MKPQIKYPFAPHPSCCPSPSLVTWSPRITTPERWPAPCPPIYSPVLCVLPHGVLCVSSWLSTLSVPSGHCSPLADLLLASGLPSSDPPSSALPALDPTLPWHQVQKGPQALAFHLLPTFCTAVPLSWAPAHTGLPLEQALCFSHAFVHTTPLLGMPPSLCAEVIPILPGPGESPSHPSSLVWSPKPDVISACDKSRCHALHLAR